MRIPLSRFASQALTFFIVNAVFAGCSGSQTSSVPTATEVASVAHATQRVSPDGIVYTFADVKIDNSEYNLDLNNDGITDFGITESKSTTQGRCNPERGQEDVHARLSLSSGNSNGSEVRVNGYVARVTRGSPIGPSRDFATGSWPMESFSIIWRQFGSLCVDSKKVAGNWPWGSTATSGWLSS